MSLKELKRLAPWGWESKIATKKHKIGPKGLEEWEQVGRIVSDGSICFLGALHRPWKALLRKHCCHLVDG